MMSFAKILHKSISTYLSANGLLTDATLIDDIFLEDPEFIKFLKEEGTPISSELEDFVDMMKTIIPEEDPKTSSSLPTQLQSLLIPSLPFEYILMDTNNKKYYRQFDYIDLLNQRGAITSLFHINMGELPFQISAILYHFLENAEDQKIIDFIKCQIEQKPYFLLFSLQPITGTYDLFCNIFSCYIASGKNVQINSNLQMIDVQDTYGTVLHDNNAQYFPLVDYLNEINKSSDVLNQYLKSYRIVEYLVWRSLITRIVNSNEFTVTNFLNAVEKKNNESSTLEERFHKIFTDISLIIVTSGQASIDSIFNQSNNFLKAYRKNDLLLESYNDFKSDPTRNKFKKDFFIEIIRTIYFFRNAIAHNKYSEFSISYWNYESYKDAIPLIHLLIKFIFRNAVQLITQNQCSEIHFNRQELELF